MLKKTGKNLLSARHTNMYARIVWAFTSSALFTTVFQKKLVSIAESVVEEYQSGL